MRAPFVSGITAIVVSCFVISGETPLLANGACNDASLRGSYAFRVDGTGVSHPGVPGPFAAVGKNTYDGKGGMKGEIVLSNGGVMYTSDYTGTYTVHAGCTGTKSATLSGLGGLTVDFSFVIDSNGRGIQMIVTEVGGVGGVSISGSARKLFTGAKDQGDRRD
jgi:hypothetical protein